MNSRGRLEERMMRIPPCSAMNLKPTSERSRRRGWPLMLALTLVLLLIPGTAFAQEKSVVSNLPMDVHEFMEAAGTIGMLTIVLSVAVVALVIEFLFRIRRGAFMPHGLAEDTYHLIQQGQFQQAQTH